MCLNHLPRPGRSVSQVHHGSTISGVLCPLGELIQAVTFLADVNCPGSQEDVVSNWEPAQSGVRCRSQVKIAAASCLQPWLLRTCLQRGEGPIHSQLALLWYLLNPFFCEQARLCTRAFYGKVLSFFLSLVIPQFGLLSHVSSLRLFSEHSGLVLTLTKH